jgi:hypothetical protein
MLTNMKKLFSVVLALIIIFIPSIVAAAYAPGSYRFPSGANDTFADIIFWVLDWMNLAVQGIIALAALAFLWGVLNSIYHGNESSARIEGGKFILYGVIGLAVMLSFWGLVQLVLNTFNLNPQGSGFIQFQQRTQSTSGTVQSAPFSGQRVINPNSSNAASQSATFDAQGAPPTGPTGRQGSSIDKYGGN